MFGRVFLWTLKRLIACLFVLWSITVFMLILRRFLYKWYKLQTLVVKLKLRTIFSTGLNTRFFFSVWVTSVTVIGWRNLSLECKPSMLQIIFHTVLCAAISLEWLVRIVASYCRSLNEQSHTIWREDSLRGKICLIRQEIMWWWPCTFPVCWNEQNC